MKRAFAVIVLLGLLAPASLAASESLTNRAGRTATAVTVTFSEEVRITSYDEGVFPTKEPSSRSETFRFSGGQLENGARFSVSWTPSGAEVTSTEWETTGSASTGSTASGVPLTYEQIMAQIAHYPGPDEPLYVPVEGEQIWLTDLEGHADIYDNDSIKINYAPSFDKSQITKIDVYRNGVKMRFVPALFDILTNEQMKTFDGSSAEKSPASKQTDHAIMGYTYSLRIFKASSSSPLRVLSASIKSGVTWHPKYVYAYMDGRWNQYMAYFALSDGEILDFFRKLVENGFNGISLDFNLFVDDPRSNTVTTQSYDPASTTPWGIVTTPTVADFSRVISLAMSASLQVNVRGHYYMSDKYLAEHPGTGEYSGTMNPSSIEAWLNNSLALLRPYLQLFEELHVERFTTFTENDSIERHVSELQAYFTGLASLFGGDIGFEESTNHYLEGYGYTTQWVDAQPFEQLVGRFWGWTDTGSLNVRGRRLMVEWSCWEVELETQNDQRLSQLIEEFVSFWTPAQVFYRSTYPGHEIVWGEIGTYPADGISRGSDYLWQYVRGHEVFDLQEFNDAWAAFLTASAALGMDGIEVWYVPLCDKDDLYVFNSSIKTDSSTFALIGSFFKP
jgi:hypothetical protein